MTDQPREAHPHRVVTPHTPIIGREQQIRAASDLLDQAEVRLVTLTGTGGVGKTRLALEVLSTHAVRSGSNAIAVSLAPLRDAELVLPAVAGTLGVDHDGAVPLPERIAQYVAGKPLLLLLDNLEHLPAAAPAIADLLEACTGLKILATSRTPLHTCGEHIFDVPPLALPDPLRLSTLPELAQTEAVAMFVQRARGNDPEFELTPDNAGVIAAICARLDGLPLAIELAAVRLQVLSPPALLERLSHRLDLLTRGSRSLPKRHQTLRSTIDWSYDQLQMPERRMFQRLAVFAGGSDLAAAEYVTGWESGASPPACKSSWPRIEVDTLDTLSELLDSALLRREVVAGEPRFLMLETIREYAHERLESTGDATEVRRRHAEYFAALAEEAEPALSVGRLRERWPDRLEREHGNLRTALTWSLEQGDPTVGLRLAAALVWFWWIRGHLVEGSRWLEHALARSQGDRSALRSKLLDGAGKLARTRGDLEHAEELHRESLGIAGNLGDDVSTTRALANLALVAEAKGHIGQATNLFEDALALARTSGQREVLASILTNYGLMKLSNESQRHGVALLEEGLIIARELGPSGLLGAILSNLGDARLEQGDQAAATSMYRDCLALQSELGNKRGIADALLGMGTVAIEGGALQFSARLLASSQALYESITAAPPPAAVRQFDQALERLKAGLHEATFSAVWTAGRNANLQSVIAEVLAFESSPSSDSGPSVPFNAPYSSLTSRELDVLRLLAQGYSNREIANALYISPLTAATHVKRIRAKIGVSTRTAAAVLAHRYGLI